MVGKKAFIAKAIHFSRFRKQKGNLRSQTAICRRIAGDRRRISVVSVSKKAICVLKQQFADALQTITDAFR